MVRGVAVVAAGALMLAGCGTLLDETFGSQAERPSDGAAIGRAAGELAPAGADAGAAAAALIPSEAERAKAAAKKPARARVPVPSDAVRAMQLQLTALGYEPGPPDGLAGPRTRAALKRYQEDRGLPADGKPTRLVMQRIAGEAEQGSQLTAMVEVDACGDEARRRAGLLRAAIRWIFAEKGREACGEP